MGYTNSSLVVCKKLSPNHSGQRNHSIDRITPHCVVGQCSAEGLGDWFAKSSTQASSNYGIDKDGRVGLYVEEANRSWCSSSSANDNRAVTIECASDTQEPYWMNDKVYATLIQLCADICRRNGKTRLLWLGEKDKTLAYAPAADEMVLTVHRWFANKSCPGNWLYARLGDLAGKVTAALGGTAAAPAEERAAATAAKLVAVAVSQIGYHEKASNASLDDPAANSGSANFTKYARDIDEKWPAWYNGKKNGYAWCDVYCDWCFLTAFGYEKALELTCQPERSAGAGCTFSLGYYKAKGQFHTSGPKAGDQIFFGTSLSNATHTGIVEKVEGGKVHTVEGNTSDQVARRSYSLTDSSILGYGRPAYDAEETGADTSVPASKYYRVRKSWADKASQIGAYTVFKNAVNAVDANPGYAAFDDSGNQVYPKAETTFKPYLVKVTVSDLNYRKGPSTGYASWGFITPGVYTIVDEQNGWGLLKAYADKRNGWICLDYAKKL